MSIDGEDEELDDEDAFLKMEEEQVKTKLYQSLFFLLKLHFKLNCQSTWLEVNAPIHPKMLTSWHGGKNN